MLSPRVLLYAVGVLSAICHASAALEIERYDRQVSLKNQFVVDIQSITLTNDEEAPGKSWQWCTLEALFPRLAYLSVSVKDDPTERPSFQTRKPIAMEGTPAGIICVANLPLLPAGQFLKQGDSEQVTVSAVFTQVQEPFPKTKTQGEPQRVLHKSHAYALSPYMVKQQGTKFDLPSNDVISYTKAEGTSKKGSTIIYGPYADVPPFRHENVEFHYVNNAPFAVGTVVVKKVDVGRWGTLKVDERYVVRHGGAKLVGPWSRHSYAADPLKYAQAAFREMPAQIPPIAQNVYFRDVIGNVSTSAVRMSKQEGKAALLPRIPLFGGWSTDFEFGFTLPAAPFKRTLPDGRTEMVLSYGPQVKNLVIDEYVYKLELPEGATEGSVDVPFEVELTFHPKYTYLNKQGRTVMHMRTTNMIDALSQPFVVRYRVPPLAWAREPALWGGSLAAILATLVFLARADFSLVRPEAAAKGCKSVPVVTTGQAAGSS